MKLSIVTISYNQRRFVEQAIRSVLDQDYDDFEYIVVDPGSTDGSREVVDKYRDRLTAIVFEPDGGPADGLNKGFARARGDLYGYLNADDYFLPGALRRVEQCFRNCDCDVIIGNSLIVDHANRVRRYHYSDRFNLVAYAYGHAQIMQASTFFKSSIFHAVGGFNPGNSSSWDGELLVELAGRCALRYCESILQRFQSILGEH
jgi:glycosyltransferase involved in cell wall biosynthesis